MATDLAKLVVSLEAQNTKLLQKLEQSEKATEQWRKKTERAVSNVGKAFGGLLAGGAALAGFSAVLKASAESEKAVTQLESALKSTGGTVGFTSKQLQEFAAQLQSKSTFDDEAIINLQTRLLSFGNVTGDVFKRATQATADLSARLGRDLSSSALLVGKALNDPIKGLAGLSRAGIQFSADQKQVIKGLAESGRLAEAQGIILDALAVKYGGAAEAARNTFAGALQALGNAFGNLLEAPGGLNDATKAVNDFTRFLEDPATQRAAATFTNWMVQAFTAVGVAITGNIQLIDRLVTALAGAGAGQITTLQNRIGEVKGELERQAGYFAITETEYEKKLKSELVVLEQQLATAIKIRNERMTAEHMGGKGDWMAFPAISSRKYDPASFATPSKGSKAKAAPDTSMMKLSTEYANALMRQADSDWADIEARWAEEKQMVADLNSLKLDAMSSEERALVNLQTKYTELQTLIAKGAVTQEEAAKIAAGLATQWAAGMEEKTTEMSEFAKAAAQNMQSAFADFLFDPFENGLKGMLLGFVNTLRRMAAEAIAAQIFDNLLGKAGGGSGSGLLGSVLGAFSGAHDKGGSIPSGGWGIAGEKGPEIVTGPANVVSRMDTSRIFGAESGGKAIRIVNAFDTSVIGDYLGSDAGEQLVMNTIQRNGRKVRQVVG